MKEQIIEFLGIMLVLCSIIILCATYKILREVKSRDYHKLEKQFDGQRLDLLKITIYLESIPDLDKIYNFNEYIAHGGNHGVIEKMMTVLINNKDVWWSVYEREKDTVITNEKYRDHYNNVIADIKRRMA